MKQFIDIFAALNESLSTFGQEARSNTVIENAIAENAWFTRSDIMRAVDAIRQEMLNRDKLTEWLSHYPATPTQSPRRVAVIMAGNIPLVGFFDLLAVIAAGHKCYVKPSSKDKVLMSYVIELLRDIEPSIEIFDYSAEETYDMAIATGGDSANKYFREHFSSTQTLLRGSRHSVAILDGTESHEELQGLYNDITAYSGLGCRSVSMLFVPRGYVPCMKPHEADNIKLQHNIRATKALLSINGSKFYDMGAFLMVHGDRFSESLAHVTLKEYRDIEEVKAWLEDNDEHVQCVVSHMAIERSVAFGEAQYPTLMDYADGVDTMRFLLD